jgi:hypothetical protein
VAVEEIKTEAAFDSFSSPVILSLSVSMAAYLQRDPAILCLRPIMSSKQVPETNQLQNGIMTAQDLSVQQPHQQKRSAELTPNCNVDSIHDELAQTGRSKDQQNSQK